MFVSIDANVEVPKVGPRGGDLDAYQPEWRREHHQGATLLDGTMGLHRFEKQDTATNGLKNEQPWHRMAAYMLNAGRTNSEIALAANVDAITVSQLRSQRWFQELCATIANNVGEEIVGALQSYGLEAVEEIHSIAQGAESDSVKLKAYQLLLEHTIGKPLQKVITDATHRHAESPNEELEDINRQLALLRGQKVESST